MTKANALRAGLGAAALSALIAVGCAAPPRQTLPAPLPPAPAPPPPPPDGDATPDQATTLALGVRHSDSLDRAARDLDDWYRIELPKAGTLRVSLSGSSGAALPYVFVSITDGRGLASAQPLRAGGRPRVDLPAQQVSAGTRLVWVGTEPESNAPVAYELRADFTPRAEPRRATQPPPPPPPQYRVFPTRLVELGGGAGGAAQEATIAGGVDAGLAVGMRGRLVNAGRVLGTFEIVEVYAKGSRVRIDGKLEGSASGASSAEVDVPVR